MYHFVSVLTDLEIDVIPIELRNRLIIREDET
jgi:hypothetical protein